MAIPPAIWERTRNTAVRMGYFRTDRAVTFWSGSIRRPWDAGSGGDVRYSVFSGQPLLSGRRWARGRTAFLRGSILRRANALAVCILMPAAEKLWPASTFRPTGTRRHPGGDNQMIGALAQAAAGLLC